MFRSRYGGWKGLRSPDFPLLNRLLGGESPTHGELLSYLFFDPEFIEELIEMGKRDAQRWLDTPPGPDDPWQVEPLEDLHALVTGAQRIRDLVAAGTVLMPGVYDALSARIADRVGFEIVFISGYSVSAVRLGEPDFGFVTQTEMAEAARTVCRVSSAPVIVDADTGYGNALNVIRTVHDFQDAGAAGVFLEDQVWPKKCGHFAGKQVVPTDEHATKIRAACDARGERDLFVVARTDARQPLGLEQAIERCLAYKEAGADALFVEAPQSVNELERVAEALPPPLVANMIERGVTPHLTRASSSSSGTR